MKETKELFMIMAALIFMLGWACYYYSPAGPNEDRIGSHDE